MVKYKSGDIIKLCGGRCQGMLGKVLGEQAVHTDEEPYYRIGVINIPGEIHVGEHLIESASPSDDGYSQLFFELQLPDRGVIKDGVTMVGDESFFEMATIKGGFMSIKLAVYGAERGNVAHFHFYKGVAENRGIPKNKLPGGGCICIRSANYFVHADHTDVMNNDEIRALKDFLKKKNDLGVSNWKTIIALWNMNNPDMIQIPTSLKIPDYKGDMKSIT